MSLSLKSNHKVVTEYYREMHKARETKQLHEGAVAPHFANLLRYCLGQSPQLTLVEQYSIKRDGRKPLRADGALVDKQTNVLLYGIWEAKDSKDKLEKEVKSKFKDGYPADNILFQSPDQVILYQHGEEVFNQPIAENPENLVTSLELFLTYKPPVYEQWEEAVAAFKEKVGELGLALVKIILRELKTNITFKTAFEDFGALCRAAINPNLAQSAVIEMLVQHLLTERLFRTIFDNSDFVSKNVIAKEIEKVIQALTSSEFSRSVFLKDLDRFYIAIEETARTIHAYSRKQDFLNAVYENFFQGFAVKVADTHGIVYTPQPIVDFMVNSVQEILRREFNQDLSSEGVHVLDPFTGTGNFILRVMQEVNALNLERKYREELHCNEIMLLPYYIASMNIEHAYYEYTKKYKPFSGICLVDTFELSEPKQQGFNFFVPENTERVNTQKAAPIFVIIGNPPYNVGQQDENDNNRNRKYPHLDGVIAEKYAKYSKATLKSSLSDVYIKAFAWATERLQKQESGIIAFVTNNGFLDGIATDGMRQHLGKTFNHVYVLNLGGNVRQNPKLSGTTHNVFGIQVGVAITFLVKNGSNDTSIHYADMDTFWTKIQKFDFLQEKRHILNLDLQNITPDTKHNWLTDGLEADFETFVPMGSKEGKACKQQTEGVLFKIYSRGVATNGDAYVYNYNVEHLSEIAQGMVENFNSETDRWKRSSQVNDMNALEAFLNVNERILKWIRHTKRCLLRKKEAYFDVKKIRRSLYRPYTTQYFYFDKMFSEDFYQFPSIFPTPETEQENRVICCTNHSQVPFVVQITNLIAEVANGGRTGQCFPFYIYDETGEHRQENITDWALKDYQAHYADENIGKWDIFYYIYGVLHHQGYRDKYAANLKRELPRIPKLKDFWKLSHAGKQLAELHLNYETQKEFPLKIETHDVLDWRVEKMRFNKEKTAIKYNDSLTLSGIPPEALEYRLGNRSALDWIIDQYQISTDKRSGITNDPNNLDDERYIVKLVMKIVTVSVETVKWMGEISACEL